jgi:hypothetical protein
MVAPVTPNVLLPSGAALNTPRTTPGRFAAALRAQTPAASPDTVSPVRTQLSGSEAAEALAAAWTERNGSPPSERTLAILTAQWSHETGRGESMFNYNFGGIKGAGPSGLSVAQRTTEGSGASARRITDNFRAYTSAAEGASDYLALLERRYGGALDAARAGDAEGFVRGLKSRGYFTGDEGAYVESVSRLAAHAEANGFDAIGAGGSEPLPVLGPAAPRPEAGTVGANAELLARFSDALIGASLNEAPTLDAWRITDAMSRSALRIGNDDEQRG